MKYLPIGIIHSPFMELENMPIQPTGAAGIQGTIDVYEDFHAGLKDLEGFSHIILLYSFHHSHSYKLQVIPFLDSEPRGVFATRAPKRPNAIGLSIVQLDKIEDGILYIQNVDILDGTPLLDIKPYVPEFDAHPAAKRGWYQKSGKNALSLKSDDRFK